MQRRRLVTGIIYQCPFPPSILVFLPGETTKTFSVQVIGDTRIEPDEKFFVNLSNPTGATFPGGGFRAVALATIIDDDAAPKISMNNVSIAEGNSGTTNAVFSVQRSGNLLGQPLGLNYSTSNGTARAASDYVATKGILLFAPGQTNQTITVPVIGDTVVEPDETFFVNLGSESIPNLFQGKGTIINDDTNNTLTISPISDQTIVVNTTTAPIPFTVTNAIANGANLLFSASSSNPTLVPNENIQFGGRGLNRAVVIIPAPDQTGDAIITISAFDGVATGSLSFALRVNKANTPPTISSIPNWIAAPCRPTGEIAFIISDLETPAEALRLKATSSNKSFVLDQNLLFGGFGRNRTISIFPTVGQVGQTVITLEVADIDGGSASAQFFVTAGGLGPVFKNDFNQDGFADILFQNSDGSIGAWFMNRGPEMYSASLFNPSNVGDAGWQIVGSDVLEGSQSCGNPDLLFQHKDGTLAMWRIYRMELTSSALLNPSQPGPGWTVVATGDVNRDGRKNILFQHTDGILAVWYMDGINLIEGKLFNPSNPGDPRWRVVGAVDLRQIGSTDLIFQHSDGTLAAWYMDGINLVQSVLLNPSTPGGDWRVAGTVDLNHDGRTDLLFQHSDGSVGVWFMNGIDLISAQMLNPSHPGDGWRIVGPR